MDLAKTQLISIITKGVTFVLGVIQGIIVVRILSPEEYGLIGIVMAIGGVVGVSQHLGVVDGAIREIAIRSDKRDIGKVFWVSHILRQAVTIPLSLGLALLAQPVAVGIYNKPELVPFILLFSSSLILQGLQDVLGATLTGMKKFIPLYVVQIITAIINIFVFWYFTWKFHVPGFFYAIIVTTSIMVALYIGSVARALKENLHFPSLNDITSYGRAIMKISVFMYLARIFFVLWQNLPILILGKTLAISEIGFIKTSLFFGSKLTIIAMALSEVNLSWMSSLYEYDRTMFVHQVTKNMHRVLVLMLLVTLVLMFFSPEILIYFIGREYLPANQLIPFITFAFFLYALTDIGTSSVFVPTNNPKLRALVYGIMTAISAALIGWILYTGPTALHAVQAVLAGSAVAYVLMVITSRKAFHVNMVSGQLVILIAALGASVLWLSKNPDLTTRIIVFIGFTAYATWEAYRSKLIPDWKKLVPKNIGSAHIPSVGSRIHEKTIKQEIQTQHVTQEKKPGTIRIICFAGAEYDQPTWTNRQHMMSRISKFHPVLYVEPRVWIIRYIARNITKPLKIIRFFKRLIWYESVKSHNTGTIYIKAQWNLIPWSREIKSIATLNHLLNRYHILIVARLLGFRKSGVKGQLSDVRTVLWIYDTEAAEYLSAFKDAFVLYDCVDDHAAQAGPDRNRSRVEEEETEILKCADLVTVTSRHLYNIKRQLNANVHLVLNAGDVSLYASKHAPVQLPFTKQGIVLGTVGALDSYKVDFEMLWYVAIRRPEWQIVFIGAPVVQRKNSYFKKLMRLPNVHFIGTVERHKVPSYVYSFDICLIPYKMSTYNRASFPLKFWEFMSTGKPIIVSGLPELTVYKDLIDCVKRPKEFIAAVERIIKKDTYKKQRIDLAKDHSLEKRVAQMLHLLHNSYQHH